MTPDLDHESRGTRNLHPEGLPAVSHSVAVFLRRDESRDRRRVWMQFAGDRLLWSDGREVDVAMDAFCRHGQRMLGVVLDRHLYGWPERLVEILGFPAADPDGPMTRLPGHRVRQFFLRRRGTSYRLRFLDGTATQTASVLGRGEPSVVEWIGLHDVPDCASTCLDLAARPASGHLAPEEGPVA